MHPQIELRFRWRRKDIKEAIVAVTRAVAAGNNTKNKLLAALPQFAIHRIALAIDALIAADMATNNLGVLSIHPDINVVFELLNGKFALPLSLEEAKAPGMHRLLISKLGCKYPAGVEALLYPEIVEV